MSTKAAKLSFSKHVTQAEAQQLAHKPVQTANHVYGHRLGNRGRGTNDGWDFRGSGFIQLTGRENFRSRGKEIGMPLEAHPELVRRPNEGFKAGIAYWRAKKINKAADVDSIVIIRRLVNGGNNGLNDSRIWYARAKRYFVAPDQPPAMIEAARQEEIQALQEKLEALGFLPPTDAPANVSDMAGALKAFQASQGIPETGEFDEDTLYAITDPDSRLRD